MGSVKKYWANSIWSLLFQSPYPSSETIQLQRSAVHEQQAWSTGGDSQVFDFAVPLLGIHTTPRLPWLESSKLHVSIVKLSLWEMILLFTAWWAYRMFQNLLNQALKSEFMMKTVVSDPLHFAEIRRVSKNFSLLFLKFQNTQNITTGQLLLSTSPVSATNSTLS